MADIELNATGRPPVVRRPPGRLVLPRYVEELRVRNSPRPYLTVVRADAGRPERLATRRIRPVDLTTSFDIRLMLDPSSDRLVVVGHGEQETDLLGDLGNAPNGDDLELLLRWLRVDVYEVPLGDLPLDPGPGGGPWIRVPPTWLPPGGETDGRPPPDMGPPRTIRPREPGVGAPVSRPPSRLAHRDGTTYSPSPPSPLPADLMGGGSPGYGWSETTGDARLPVAGQVPAVPSRARLAYTRVDCPAVVRRAREFELTVGLGPEPDLPGDEPLDLPPPGFVLDVQVIAPNWLSLRQGEHWRHELYVSETQPYPVVTVHPIVRPDVSASTGTMEVLFRVGTRLVGRTERSFAIADPDRQAPATPPRHRPARALRCPPSKAPPVDVEITVDRHLDDPVDVLRWTYDSRHGRSSGEEALRRPLGVRPDEFAAGLVRQLDRGGAALAEAVRGLGRAIARTIPDEVWQVLAWVATRTPDGIPTVLIHTTDPHVPWELAALERPLSPATKDLPPLLGAHARIGRWNPRDQLDPVPHDLVVDRMVVVEGGYRPRLRHAAREAKSLRKTYGATLVKARMPDVLRCLSGAELPDARALHFAVHGTFAAQDVVDSGLRLADREYLSPAKVEGSRLANQPLVFLNACQVASGSMQLGMSASLPDAFLAAQATGVVAPLWSVHDDEATTVAVDFYREVLAGVHPAEYVRRLRASVDLGGELDRRTASRLAYQFYGHPVLTVRPLPRAT